MSRIPKTIEKTIREKYHSLDAFLNEKSRRLWAATEARAVGRGGIALLCRVTGMSNNTIHRGLKEIQIQNPSTIVSVRRKGGGRKALTTKQPELLKELEYLVEPLSRGDPESPLRWTSKSTYKLSKELVNKNFSISQSQVSRLLNQLGYSLQSNRKLKEGLQNPDRNAQFEYINQRAKDFISINSPVISVDTKKKELIGEYKNNGREYCKKKQPTKVNTHDFPDKKLGKVAPYGIYDIGKNKGWVSVGISKDTAEFAVNSIRAWWYKMGSLEYPNSKELLITADCGGSNGYRIRLWKFELQKLANELGKVLYVCHFPPGTSKWNKIEHKMFSYISQNWRGKPLITREVVVNLIGNTKTNQGLEIKAMLDLNEYKTGIEVPEAEYNKINLSKMDFHGEWNYKIEPNLTRES